MNRRSSHLKQIKGTYLLLTGLWLLSGLVLLVWPRFSSSLICTVLGVLCAVYGVIKLFGYFSRDPYKLAFQFDLALGILCLIFGAVLLFFPEALLSLLPVLIGLFSLVSGVFKLQTAFEAKRFGMRKWWGMLLLSLVTIAAGAVLLVQPFQSALLAIRFIGLAVLVTGFQDLATTAYTVNTRSNGVIIDVDDFREL